MTAAIAFTGMHLVTPAIPPEPSASMTAENFLPESSSVHAKRWQASIAEHLRSRDEYALVRTVAEAADVLPSAERLLACWIPCLIGLETARRSGRPLSCASSVARFIAVSARVALMPYPFRTHAPWLVGMTLIDQSAAHLIALLLVRRGVSSRPWWAPDMPRRGSYMMVSTVYDDGLGCGNGRCLGMLTLANEARIARDRHQGHASRGGPELTGSAPCSTSCVDSISAIHSSAAMADTVPSNPTREIP